MTTPWPVELKWIAAEKSLDISFDDGSRFLLPAEYLRVESPSAEVQGHDPSARQWVGGKRQVMITAIEPVGNYAVRIHFDDDHSSGLYSWDYLHQLGRDRETIWKRYIDALAARGLSRD